MFALIGYVRLGFNSDAIGFAFRFHALRFWDWFSSLVCCSYSLRWICV